MPKKKSTTQKSNAVKKSVTPKVEVEVEMESQQDATPEEKSSLTDLEKFWVEQNCKNGKSLDEVMSANIQPISLVEAHYKQTDAEMKEEATTIKASKLFGRNEKYGAVVMTQTASELGDTKKPSQEKARRASEAKQNHIHKFRNR